MSKRKKEIAPWRQDLFAGHKRKPSAIDRSDFPAKVIAELIKEAKGVCQSCDARRDEHTHHVMPRARGGRGVKENGLRVCNECHTAIHASETLLQKWIFSFTEKYGERFWYDDQDWGEYKRRASAAEAEAERNRRREEELKPIVRLLATSAKRSLSTKEILVLEFIHDQGNAFAVLSNLMREALEQKNSHA